MTIQDLIADPSGRPLVNKILLAALIKYRIELTAEDFAQVEKDEAAYVVWRIRDGVARFWAMSKDGMETYMQEHR